MAREDDHERLFVATETGFLCADCIPSDVDLGDPQLQVWLEYTAGWTGPCVCTKCNLSIPVYVDG